MCGGKLRGEREREREASNQWKLPPSWKLGAKAIWVIDRRMASYNADEANQKLQRRNGVLIT